MKAWSSGIGLSNVLIITLFAAASLLRLAEAFRPINQPSWRESDLGSISRNFVEEGMNPLYPRIDWRGDGPGFAEMELPIYPFLTAATYEIFGIHDQIGRLWSLLFSLGTMFFFFKLAREYLTLFASTVAFAFFALNPLMVVIGTSIQPDGLMILTYISGVYFFLRWLKTENRRYFWAAAATTALMLLAKAPSAHIGLLFGVLLIEKYGWRAIKEGNVWIFGIVSLLPPALWYFHAKNLWIVYGNSLGLSNEHHWIGWDFFTDAEFISGILHIEFASVWVGFGVFVGAFAIWRGYREETLKLALLWLASIFAFYILAARTTSEDWAVYYHAISIPPVALIIGLSIKKLWDYAGEFADAYSQRGMIANLGRVFTILFVLAAIFASLRIEAKQVRANFIESRLDSPAFVFAERIRPLLKPDGLIVVSGGYCKDRRGYQVAYNASYMFYWLGKKGWNVCVEEQSMSKLREFASKGATYFVAEKKYLVVKPELSDELDRTYPRLADSDDFMVFDLGGSK